MADRGEASAALFAEAKEALEEANEAKLGSDNERFLLGVAQVNASLAVAALLAETAGLVKRHDLTGEPATRWARVLSDAPKQDGGDEQPAPVFPTPGTEVPGRPGYVVGTCGHHVAKQEWRAGLRTCERCPDPTDAHDDDEGGPAAGGAS